LPGGTAVLWRTGNSNNNTTNNRSATRRSISITAHRPPHISAFSNPNGASPNSIQNAAVNSHQICHSTDEPNEISVDKTKVGFRSSGNETTKLTRLSANADTKRINGSTGESSKALQGPAEISVKRAIESVARSQNTVGESSEATAGVTSGQYVDDGQSANVTRHSQQSASTVHSPNTSQLSTCDSAKRRHKSENTSHEHLRGNATTAQDCAGSSGKRPNKTQRPDGGTRRKREDVNETRDAREYKTRTEVKEVDLAEETKRKGDYSACGTRGSAERTHTECQAQIRQDSSEKKDTRVLETSSHKNNKHPDIKDQKKADYSADDNTKQVENPASVKNKGIQRFSHGKLKRTGDISIEESETGGLTEHSAENRGKTQEGSAEQVVVGSFATVHEEQDTDSVTVGKSEKLRQASSAMSRRPQVLKITDSVTTAFRRRDGNKHVSSFSVVLR
jgi:hypothetical protein